MALSPSTDNILQEVKTEVHGPNLKSGFHIGRIKLSSCEDVHFGPKFIGSSVNYIDKSKKNLIILIVLVTIITVLLIGILVALIIKKVEINNNSEVTTPTDPVTPTDPAPTTHPPITSTTSTAPTQPTPPDHWYVSFDEWSIRELPKCYEIAGHKAFTIAVDSSKSCDTLDNLRIMQEQSGLRHNFYITQTCQVYEGFGWSCTAQYSLTFSRSHILIAICGVLKECQKTLFERLIDLGASHKYLNVDYNIMPECCRGFRNKTGPGKEINQYLRDRFSTKGKNKFFNTGCLSMPSCGIS